MKKKETVAMQNKYIDKLVKYLPVLRAAANMTQSQPADKAGVNRQTILFIEIRKRPMSWTLGVFQQYEDYWRVINCLIMQ